ncbi:MAG: hypothetical protein NC320_08730 [Clostridium sp.]|nr:hypothetical protein [Clostridium sp.]
MKKVMEGIPEIIPHSGHSDLTYEEYLEKRVKAYNSSYGNLTGYDCKKCLNRGNKKRRRDNDKMRMHEKACGFKASAKIRNSKQHKEKNFFNVYR